MFFLVVAYSKYDSFFVRHCMWSIGMSLDILYFQSCHIYHTILFVSSTSGFLFLPVFSNVKADVDVSSALPLKRTYDRNVSKRPAFQEIQGNFDVTSRLLSGIFCKKNTSLFTKKQIKTKLCLDRVNIRSTKYLFGSRNTWSLGIISIISALQSFLESNFPLFCFCFPTIQAH